MYTDKIDNSQLNYEQKFTKAMLKLRRLRTYYACIYENMQKVESNTVDTMGVTTNKLVYNREFVENIPFDEFMFVNLHEIAHIALMHVARRENRDPKLWNIAADLYVNQVLLTEFNLSVGESSLIDGSIDIKPPEDGLYCTSIDLDKDYVEAIYESFEKQGKENGYFSGSLSGDGYGFSYKGKKSQNRVGANNDKEYETFNIQLGDQEKYNGDLIETGEDQNSKEQQSRKIISDAIVRSSMIKQAGKSPGNLERLSTGLIESKVDWRKLLRRYLIKTLSSDTSFSNPDKRMYYQRAIYPGKAFDCDTLQGLKVCIDVSGSISEEDLAAFRYQVLTLTKEFKLEAELLYWDADIQSKGSFKDFTDFSKVPVLGGGGTNAAVIFKYFNEHKIKPTVTIVLTDGYFNTSFKSVNKGNKYKNTIWILTKEHSNEFKPPFGRIAYAKF